MPDYKPKSCHAGQGDTLSAPAYVHSDNDRSRPANGPDDFQTNAREMNRRPRSVSGCHTCRSADARKRNVRCVSGPTKIPNPSGKRRRPKPQPARPARLLPSGGPPFDNIRPCDRNEPASSEDRSNHDDRPEPPAVIFGQKHERPHREEAGQKTYGRE